MRLLVSTLMKGLASATACGLAVAAPSLASIAAAEGTICEAEQYSWIGQATIAAGGSFDTGVVIADQPGTQLAVNAVDYSADVVPAPLLSIQVGPTVAANGVALTGGSIGATNGGTQPLTVTVIALSINRCHQVEQAPAVGGLAVVGPASAGAPATALQAASASAAVAPATPAAAAVPVPSEGLPATGSTSVSLIYGASSLTIAGFVMVALSRRRVHVATR